MANPEAQGLVSHSDSDELDGPPRHASLSRSTRTDTPLVRGAADEAPAGSFEMTPFKKPGRKAHGVSAAREAASAVPTQPRPGTWRQWWVEILCCVLMTASLCAIVGILSRYNGEALPDLPFEISINTVIAILGTTIKATAALILAEGISHLKWQWFRKQRPLGDLDIFDRASRGPWGCAKLLVARPGLLSCLAALLTILTIAVDPFTQQLIRYNGCTQEIPSSHATLPRANLFFRNSAQVPDFLPEIMRGILCPTLTETPFSCPTSNCSFDQPFPTLGFCSICEDLTSQLTFQNVTVPLDSFTPDFSLNFAPEGEDQNLATIVNTTLPSGSYALSNMYTYPGLAVGTDDGANGSRWLEIVQASAAYPGGGYMTQRHRFNARCRTEADNSTWACSGFGGAGAARCTIKPCVKTYKASIEQGQLKEEIMATGLLELHLGDFMRIGKEDPVYVYAAADLTCAGTEIITRLQEAGFHIGNDQQVVRWDAVANPDDGKVSLLNWDEEGYPDTSLGRRLNESGLPVDIIPAECLYAIDYTNERFVWLDLVHHLVGSTTSIVGPAQLLALHDDSSASFDSVSAIFANIAESLTLRARQHNASYVTDAAAQILNKPVEGKAFRQKTCISVRWGYLAFPAALVMLTATFLVVLVTSSLSADPERELAVGWKSSPLPMVFGGLALSGSEAGLVNVQSRGSIQEMQDVANTTTGRLKMD